MSYSIAFSFDDNVMVAAQVALSSLFACAPEGVHYDIYLTYSKQTLTPENLRIIEKLALSHDGNRFQALNVGDAFRDCFEIREITVPTYYRLLLPDLLPDVDRIIYADVDIVFAGSPHEALQWMQDEDLLCGVTNVYRNQDETYLKAIGVPKGEYVNAGFLVMNLEQMRKMQLSSKFLEMSKTNYTYQDQDILNITCTGRIRKLPLRYNIHAMHDYAEDGQLKPEVAEELKNAKVLHFAGIKPWNGAGSFYYDQWWEAYRRSSAYNFEFYYQQQAAAAKEFNKLKFAANHKWAQLNSMTKIQRLKSLLKPSLWQ